MANIPSKYQQAFFDFVVKGSGNVVLEAVAGSGKSFTIVESLKFIDPSKSVLFLAFNKKIADELARKVPSNVKAITFNSLGHRACMTALGSVRLNSDKTADIWRKMYDDQAITEADYKYLAYPVRRLVDLVRGVGLVPRELVSEVEHSPTEDTDEVWFQMVEEFDLVQGNENMSEQQIAAANNKLVTYAREVLRRSIKIQNEIDFGDQLYLPIIFNWKFPTFDWVFVDEAQDLNMIQRIILARCIKRDGRLAAVGDAMQAIYQFRGADFYSLENIAKAFNCVRLPLSICYRCAKNIVLEAQKVVPHIEYHENAIDGEVVELGDYSKIEFSARDNDMVICRANAPLIRLAYNLIGRRIPVKVVGRDIGTSLVSLIKKMRANGIPDLERRLASWRDREVQKILDKDPSAKTEKIDDKYEAIMVFIESSGAQSIDELIRAIQSLFEDGQRDGCVSLSSIHRAKGLEAKTVYILDRWMLPKFEAAKAGAGLDPLANLLYVGVTRARERLFYVNTPKS